MKDLEEAWKAIRRGDRVEVDEETEALAVERDVVVCPNCGELRGSTYDFSEGA